MTIGARIRQARIAAGLSQNDLATSLGITRGAVSQWEADKGTGPRRTRLKELADILGVSTAWLASGYESEVREGNSPKYLNTEQQEMLRLFTALSSKERKSLVAFLKTLRRH